MHREAMTYSLFRSRSTSERTTLAMLVHPVTPMTSERLQTHSSEAPSKEFWFGTDTMGRDIFAMIWYGGRVSLLIGALSTGISTALAVLFGTVSGLAPRWLDDLLMRLTEIFLSIPSLLLIIFLQAVLGKANVWSLPKPSANIGHTQHRHHQEHAGDQYDPPRAAEQRILLIIFLQAVLGKANVWSLSLVIGVTGWTSIAKVVRSEVLRLRNSEYVMASRCMGGGFFHILRRHLAPNFFSSIMFMVVMNVRAAIAAESTLSRVLSVISTYRAYSNHQLLLVVLTLQIIPPLLPLAPKPSGGLFLDCD